MLEQLMGLIRQHSQEAIVNNPNIPNQYNDAAQQAIGDSILGGLQSAAGGGQLGSLIGLLGGGLSQGGNAGLMNNPVMGGIAQNAVGTLMQKFGLNNGAASSIISMVLPSVMGGLIGKIMDRNDPSIDLNQAVGAVAGQQTGGFDLNQIGYAMQDGKIDMNDLMNLGGGLLGGQGGGLGGLLGGLLGGGRR